MITDKNGNELKEGDTVVCVALEFEIEEFKNMPEDGWLACGDYGCIAVNLLEKKETEEE